MLQRNKKIIGAIAGLGLALSAGACGSDDSGDSGSGALEGVDVAVGSKDFTENILLGEIFAQAMEREGASVDNKTNLGGTSVNRKALVSGEIDVYPEYNGTGWTNHLKEEEPPSQDPTELYELTAEKDLKQNDIKWIDTSEFNDTYGFAANGDLAEEEGGFNFQEMADYLEANQDATLCLETEFPDRPDGLVLFEDATGYEVPEKQIKILDTGLIYSETSDGNCEFGEVFTTDGRITALNLELVEDPGVMIIYNVSYTMQNEVYEANADTYDEIVSTILDGLDNDKMAALNAQVDVEGIPADDVASDYLDEVGL